MAVVGNFYFSIFLRLMWKFLDLESECGCSICWLNNKIIDDTFFLGSTGESIPTWFISIMHLDLELSIRRGRGDVQCAYCVQYKYSYLYVWVTALLTTVCAEELHAQTTHLTSSPPLSNVVMCMVHTVLIMNEL